jgi:hypothetical protein
VTPQKQRYTRGNAPAGEVGDCHRTCVAMILNMHRDDVPHFMKDCHPSMTVEDPAMRAAEQAEVDWLSKRGLTAVNIPFPGETLIIDLLEQVKIMSHGAPIVLGCSVNGFTASVHPSGHDHSVVIHEGKIYNPNSGATITGPMRDGLWWLTIYSVGPDWRSPRWSDRVRNLFRALAMETGTR